MDYMLILNDSEVRLLDKCLKIAKESLRDAQCTNDTVLNGVFKDIEDDITKLCVKIEEQVK